MPSPAAIQLEGISKAYKIYGSANQRFMELLSFGGRKLHREFHALRNVDISIAQGECVGILGRNGSGKSTLLQILCGILTPSTGSVRVEGRVSALLELGTGFNPDFTGWENVQLYCSLQGVPAKDVPRLIEDICAFADIGDFVHQPVKTYSSGMYVRLAFAAAIAINPDVLIVDEALAVGDEAFQRKCYGRIQDLRKRGTTILFVTHAASLIVELCDRAILLDAGEKIMDGKPKAVVAQYHRLAYAPPDRVAALRAEIRTLNHHIEESVPATSMPEVLAISQQANSTISDFFDSNLRVASTVSYESDGVEILSAGFFLDDGRPVNVMARGACYKYVLTVRFDRPAQLVRFGMLVKSKVGVELGGIVSHPVRGGIEQVEAGRTLRIAFNFRNSLNPGTYFCNAGVLEHRDGKESFAHRLVDVMMFRVRDETALRSTVMVDFTTDQICTIEAVSEETG